MTQAIDLPRRATTWEVYGLVGGVSLAHFVSHVHMLALAPMLVFVKLEYGVSYTELGMTISLYNIVSTLLQTPFGFLVDRIGARINLIGALLLGGLSLVLVGLVDSFWMMLAMYGTLGLANAVYHPADYAMLSDNVPTKQISHAYAVHGFAGLIGTAITPVGMLYLQSIVGWRGAFVGAGVIGFLAAAVLTLMREPAPHHTKTSAKPVMTGREQMRLLLSPPIMINLLFFMLAGLISGGFSNYLVVALVDLYQTPLVLANAALSTQLFVSAGGVLLGGVVLTLTSRYVTITTVCLLVIGATALTIGLFDINSVALISLMALSGLGGGIMAPSRDMIVRSVTPPGASGTVFGFVTNGFTLTGIFAPLMFGLMMDSGHPGYIFLSVAAASIACIGTVMVGARYRA